MMRCDINRIGTIDSDINTHTIIQCFSSASPIGLPVEHHIMLTLHVCMCNKELPWLY